jgi:hypothetical protein
MFKKIYLVLNNEGSMMLSKPIPPQKMFIKIFILLIIIAAVSMQFFLNSNNKNILLLKISGGLGNQLFQYSAAYNFAKKTNSDLYIYINKDYSNAKNITSYDRKFALLQLGIKESQIIYSSFVKSFLIELFLILRVPGFVFINQDNITKDHKSNLKHLYVMEDFFESMEYFKNEEESLKKLFNINNLKSENTIKIAKTLQKANSVCVHVRLGDWAKFFGELDNQYYSDAFTIVKEKIANPDFYVFSDDISAARMKLKEFPNLKYISNKNLTPLDEFYLLSKCTNTINSTSTFVWWASYLNNTPEKMIITPYNKIYELPRSYSPNDWIIIRKYKLNKYTIVI